MKLREWIVLKFLYSKLKKALQNLRSLHQGYINFRHVRNDYAQVAYSQQGEDLELNRLFPDLNNGFYIDVGAFHPFKYSNTYLLYQRGWRGINIEPNPEQIEHFKTFRKEDINLNVGVSNKSRFLKYHCFNGAAVNTFVESKAVEWSKVKGFKIKEIKEIPTLPLADIFNAHLPAGQKIELMNIDVEGMDLEVLQSNDWIRFRPQIILVEDVWQNRTLEENEIYKYLLDQNYSLFNIVGITMFFKDNNGNTA